MASYKDCVAAAAFNLRLDSVIAALENKEDSDEVDTLLKCVNSAVHEIACDYAPIRSLCKLKSSDYRIYFRDFEKNIIDIFSVKKGGKNVKYKLFFDCILVPDEGTYEIEYSCGPLKGGLETQLPWDGSRLGERIVGYGAACEYCILNGMTDDAVLWDKRFKDALFKGLIPKGEKIAAARWWG